MGSASPVVMTAPDAPTDSADERPAYADVAPSALIQVGFVFRPHGLEGELKIDPSSTDDPTRYEELRFVYLGKRARQVTKHEIVSVRYQETKRGTTVILGLEGIEDRDAAEAVAKFLVFATEEALELGEDELYVHDLVGLDVVTEEDVVLGTVANVKEMPAQDMLVVRKDESGEALIPAVEDFLIEIDVDAGRVVVRPIDGLMD